MKHPRSWIVILVTAGLVLSIFTGGKMIAHAAPDGWQNLAPGIDFQKFAVSGPNEVFVARMDRSQSQATIDTSLANGRLNNKGALYDWETIPSQFQRYEGAINYWEQKWGQTNDVLVAINGSYFENGANPKYPNTGMPEQGQVLSGWYAKRFYNGESISGFAWTLDRRAFIGGCVIHVNDEQQFVYGPDFTNDKNISAINPLPEQRPDPATTTGSIVLYTPQFDRMTPQNDGVFEILIELTAPSLIQPKPDRVVGIVKGTFTNGGLEIPFDHVVISAEGDKAGPLQGWGFKPGDLVGISQKISNGCSNTSNGPDWTRTYAGIGGDFHFLRNRVIFPYTTNKGAVDRQPRTAIAFNDLFIYFIVVDGYHENVSVGMTIAQLGDFAKNHLDALEAIALDSGSSSTMVVNGRVVNNTICNANWKRENQSCGTVQQPQLSDGLLFHTPQAPMNLQDLAVDPSGNPILVNGLMMVAVKPAAFSGTFTPGQTLTSNRSESLRLGPGTNYETIFSVPAGSPVTILDHANGLNGVYARGAYWWKIAFGSTEGWLPQSALPWTATNWSFLPMMRK